MIFVLFFSSNYLLFPVGKNRVFMKIKYLEMYLSKIKKGNHILAFYL